MWTSTILELDSPLVILQSTTKHFMIVKNFISAFNRIMKFRVTMTVYSLINRCVAYMLSSFGSSSGLSSAIKRVPCAYQANSNNCNWMSWRMLVVQLNVFVQSIHSALFGNMQLILLISWVLSETSYSSSTFGWSQSIEAMTDVYTCVGQ